MHRSASVAYPGVAIGVSMRMVSIGKNVIVPRTDAMDQSICSLKDLNII